MSMEQQPRAQAASRTRTFALVLGGALLAGGLLWAGVAWAERAYELRPLSWFPGGLMGGLFFEQLDNDGDGRIARAEMEAFRAERVRNADRNGDGRLDQLEFETFWLELTHPMRIRAFQFLDADGDGVVTTAEIQRLSDRLFTRLDRDGDGYLTPMAGKERERRGERRAGCARG